MFRGGRRNANSNGIVNNSTNADSTPLEELTLLLDKLESLVDKSMGTFLDVLISQTTSNDGKGNINNERGNGILKSIRHRFRKGQRLPEESSSSSLKSDECQTEEEQSSESSKTGEKDKVEKKKFDFRRKRKQPNAQFVPMNQTDLASFVEIVRRLSELVVIGESAAANVQSEEAKLRSLIMHQQSTTREEEINIKSDDTSDAHKFAEEERKLKEDLMKEHCESIREKISEKKEFASVYEYFFQRNGLATIGDILSGKVFNLSNFVEKRKKVLQTELEELNDKQKKRSSKEEPDDKDNRADEEMNNRAKAREDKNSRADKEKHNRATEKLNSLETISQMEDFANIVLLPPLAVATQGFQSTSILVQNVKRATSLFFLLSNNHINELIDFPLEGYHIAERNKLEGRSDRNGLILINSSNPSNLMSPRRFGSAELSELTTTFVTFLKSLALRMNGETLQFFLTYPADTTIEGDIDYFEEVVDNTNDHDDEERPLDEIAPNAKTKGEIAVNRPIAVKTIKVEFPLYERALEFCSAQNDSFVRVTAMNICLNTLRLTTVEATTDDEEPGDVAKTVELEAALGASPNAVLHNAKALPLRERLAIAQYVCTPSRVEKLASPLFTKLAQLWGELEEEFRDMEMATKVGQVDKNTEKDEDKQKNLRRKQNEKLARAREIARRKKFTKIFNDTSYNIQDELLLLEDMLKVGLTSLNEQVIEMMFATFVYPLLLQPLLLYFQRSPVAAEVLFADALSDHSSGSDIKQSDATATEKAIISAPAKSALFCLAAVFKFLTNPPLLRLLFTSVFHPLSPTTSGETMIRAKADVACMGKNGKATLRIDRVDERGKLIIDDDRETYVFGTVTGRKEISGRNSESGKNDLNDACVFVLSPALSEILQFSGQDGGLVAKSRHNPYRKAIFQCFKLNKEVSDLQDLAVMAVDSAVSVFDEKFLADLLFGLDIKRYKDNLSTDNRFDSFRGDNPNIDSNFEDDLDDRGMGGSISASVDPRLSLGEVKGGKLGFDYMDEVINAFKCCIMSVGPGGKGAWKLNYDMVAANALLHSIRGKPEAVKCASKAMESRFCEAAAFLADVPATIDTIFDSGRLWSELKNLVPVNGDESDKNNLYYGAIMDMIIRRNKGDGFADVGSILDHMLYLTKDVKNKDEDVAIFVSVSSAGSYDAVGARACGVAPLEQDAAGAAFGNAVGSTSALLKLNSFASLLDGLLSFEDMMRYVKVGGFIFKRSTGQHIPNPDDEMTIFSPITPAFDNALFGGNENIDSASLSADAMPGSVIKLPGKMVFPCVCEVPSSMAPLFSKDAAKVVSLGITWQSLYLVIEDEQMILVEPDRHSNGKGRVVTVCRLENLTLNADSNVRVDTSARRLVLICESPDLKPPGLFRFDKKLELKRKGPFSHVKRWKSSLDIWFEDINALRTAFGKIFESIVKSKASRGNSIRTYLAEGKI